MEIIKKENNIKNWLLDGATSIYILRIVATLLKIKLEVAPSNNQFSLLFSFLISFIYINASINTPSKKNMQMVPTLITRT